jgi:hypothetical protein
VASDDLGSACVDGIASRLSFIEPGRAEMQVARYILREHRNGRLLVDVFTDPSVRNRCSNEQLERVLDDAEVVRAIGEDDVDAARRQLPV